MGAALILAFNLDQNALNTLKALCAPLGIRMKSVAPEAFTLPIGAMAGIPVDHKVPVNGKPFKDPMLVMCGLNEDCFNAFLQSLRNSGLPPIPLKAVLTPTNAAWNAIQLHDELLREYEAMQRRRT